MDIGSDIFQLDIPVGHIPNVRTELAARSVAFNTLCTGALTRNVQRVDPIQGEIRHE
jgi:hypothetical protein